MKNTKSKRRPGEREIHAGQLRWGNGPIGADREDGGTKSEWDGGRVVATLFSITRRGVMVLFGSEEENRKERTTSSLLGKVGKATGRASSPASLKLRPFSYSPRRA